MTDKSINASRTAETLIIGGYFDSTGDFVDAIVTCAANILDSKPNNAGPRGVTSQDSIETGIK